MPGRRRCYRCPFLLADATCQPKTIDTHESIDVRRQRWELYASPCRAVLSAPVTRSCTDSTLTQFAHRHCCDGNPAKRIRPSCAGGSRWRWRLLRRSIAAVARTRLAGRSSSAHTRTRSDTRPTRPIFRTGSPYTVAPDAVRSPAPSLPPTDSVPSKRRRASHWCHAFASPYPTTPYTVAPSAVGPPPTFDPYAIGGFVAPPPPAVRDYPPPHAVSDIASAHYAATLPCPNKPIPVGARAERCGPHRRS